MTLVESAEYSSSIFIYQIVSIDTILSVDVVHIHWLTIAISHFIGESEEKDTTLLLDGFADTNVTPQT